MKKLTGRVTCAQGDRKIDENAVTTIELIDCSIACAASITLVSIQPKIKAFPFEFELEYDEKPILEKMGDYAIQIRIESNGKLKFVTDTRFLITNDYHDKLLDHIDMYIKAIDN